MSNASPATSTPELDLPQRLIVPVSINDRLKLQQALLSPLAPNCVVSATSPLSKLPAPTLIKVYNHLLHPRDQIAFSLTSHALAAIATCDIALPLQPGTIFISTLRTPRPTRVPYRKHYLLADLVSWSFIIPSPTQTSSLRKRRAPVHHQPAAEPQPKRQQQLKLCRSCWKYLPKQRIWRIRDDKKQLRELKRVDWAWAVMLWAKGGGKVCPTCQVPEGYRDGEEGECELMEGE
jgi:hypothetical protein